MTAKEKAVDLVDKYFRACHKSSDFELSWKVCKQCALIAVDEVINSMEGKEPNYLEKTYWHPLDYWQQVKDELTKL